jgi:acetylornithine deacetylase/succinyl-diaminopimelate desuccinylase-like protein
MAHLTDVTEVPASAPRSPLAKLVHEDVPHIKANLARLVAIPSVAFPGFPLDPVIEAHDVVVELLRGVGVRSIQKLELPDVVAPVVIGDIAGPAGAPTVLLYSHYDVVPMGDESAWQTPCFEGVEKDGAIYGRGTADAKGNLVALLGAVRAWRRKPPVGIRFVIEGQEEFGSAFATYPSKHPDLFRTEAMIIADMGNVRPGVRSLSAGDVGPAYEAARVALRKAWGRETSSMEGGGSIPLVNSLQEAAPTSEILLFGASDGYANIHAPNERVLVDELEKATVAMAEFFGEYAARAVQH